MVYQLTYNHDIVERIESRHGLHQLAAMEGLASAGPFSLEKLIKSIANANCSRCSHVLE